MSRPPEHPENPNDPWGGNPNAGGYPPPRYGPPSGPPPPGYGPPPGPPHPGYGPPSGPPPPGYGPPPGPPPPAGYGGPPPPPGYGPQPGYPAPPGYPPSPGHGFDIGDAFSWAWNKFSKNAGPLIVALLVYFVIGAVLHGVLYVLLGGTHSQVVNADAGPSSFPTGLDAVGAVVLEIVVFFFSIFVQAAFLSGALDLADGRPVGIGSFFKPRHFGTVIGTALLLGFIAAVLDLPSFYGGTLVYLLTHLALLLFTLFTLFSIAFSTDHNLHAFAALKASFTTVRSNLGSTLLSLIVQFLAVLVGAILCGVGLIVAVPVALLIQVYTYRALSGGAIAPPTP
jgi:uncharacterized membrane protein